MLHWNMHMYQHLFLLMLHLNRYCRNLACKVSINNRSTILYNSCMNLLPRTPVPAVVLLVLDIVQDLGKSSKSIDPPFIVTQPSVTSKSSESKLASPKSDCKMFVDSLLLLPPALTIYFDD